MPRLTVASTDQNALQPQDMFEKNKVTSLCLFTTGYKGHSGKCSKSRAEAEALSTDTTMLHRNIT